MLQKLRSQSVAMAFGSLTFQGATFVMLILLKPGLGADGFAFIVTQQAWASILGSVATFRLELLLFQERGYVDRSNLFTMLVFAIGFLLVAGFLINGAMFLSGRPMPLSVIALVLALGFGLHEAQSFLCVQLLKIGALLATRVCQAMGLLAAGVAGGYGVPYQMVFTIYVLGVTFPLIVWTTLTIFRMAGDCSLVFPPRSTWKRGFSLVVSMMINTVYTNVAILLASATQSTSFVADFGFIMRLLAGPITTIRQAFGHTYLASAFAIDLQRQNGKYALWTLTLQAMRRSVSIYIIFLVVITIFLFITADRFGILHPQIIFWLSFVTLFQVGVNTVAGIRTPLKQESAFLWFDLTRTVLLGAGLGLLKVVPFDITFALFSTVLYAAYIMFIRFKILGLSAVGPADR